MVQTKNIVTSNKIVGVKVKNIAEETIGQIDQLVIDKISGQICYVSLGVGGFLGIGEKHIAVPWDVLDYDTSEECFILDVDKDKLKNAQALTTDWSDWSNEEWEKDLHKQFSSHL